MKNKSSQAGFLILEILIAVILFGVVVVSVFPTIQFMLYRSRRSKYDSQASLLLQEGIEVAYNVLGTDLNWDTYTEPSYKPAMMSGKWRLVPGVDENLETRFDRTIELKEVCRDQTTGERDAPGCVIDQYSKEVYVKVSWTEAAKPLEATLLLVKLPAT